MTKKVIVICGPTASGKSELALSLAKKLNTEIICADSLTVYKDLNIGTAKPNQLERESVVHHMLDVVNAFDNFSVGDYKDKAKPIMDNLINNGKIPIICGGTGFYINSLLFEMSYGKVSANAEVREKYLNLAKEYGNEYVYNILKEVDFKASEKIHFNDIKRVVRALEIYESGTKKSDIVDKMTSEYDYKAFSYQMPREELYNRINTRVDMMIQLGLISEVEKLVSLGLTDKNQSMQGIGYKELYLYLTKKISLDEAIELIKLNSRHYAKRQITFFKKLEGITYLNKNDQMNSNIKRILSTL